MSYASAAALQQAVYARLSGDAAVTALVGSAIHDAAPPGETGGTYVTLGPEEAQDASDVTGQAARHDFVVSVVSDAAGFQTAKEIAAAVSDALLSQPITLARGHLAALWFLRARARRVDTGALRRIDLTFRALIEA